MSKYALFEKGEPTNITEQIHELAISNHALAHATARQAAAIEKLVERLPPVPQPLKIAS